MTRAESRRQFIASLQDPEVRPIFVEEEINVGVANQIKALQHAKGWTQEELGAHVGMKQATISQLENPFYGKHTLSTLKRLATAFDVALVVRFAPFSELADWAAGITPQKLAPPSFSQDDGLHAPSGQVEPFDRAVASGQTRSSSDYEASGLVYLDTYRQTRSSIPETSSTDIAEAYHA